VKERAGSVGEEHGVPSGLTSEQEREHPNERVECDQGCGAFEHPRMGDIDELRAAYVHWREHGSLDGCAHQR
jgi:hypothetical protein